MKTIAYLLLVLTLCACSAKPVKYTHANPHDITNILSDIAQTRCREEGFTSPSLEFTACIKKETKILASSFAYHHEKSLRRKGYTTM